MPDRGVQPSDASATPQSLWRARPMVLVAAVFALGIAGHGALPVWIGAWIAMSAIAAGSVIVVNRYERLSRAMLAIAIFLAGVACAQQSRYRYESTHLSAFVTDEPRLAQLELEIDRPPRVIVLSLANGRPLPPRQVALGRVTGVRTWDGWEQASGEVLLQIAEPHPRLAAGQRVRALGRLERPGPSMNPGQFDWASYYRDQRVILSLAIPNAGNISILEDRGASRLESARQHARDLLEAGFSQEQSLDHALVRAVILGDHDPELRDVQQQFRKTGTSHHLAISGMHVAILGGIVFGLCRLLLAPPGVAWLIAAGMVLAYGFIALPSAPVVRSVLLWAAVGLALLSGRRVDLLQLLAGVLVAMLAFHPLDLFSAGFQLSFGCVFGLILFTRPMHDLIAREDVDLQIARYGQRLTMWQLIGRRVDRGLTSALAATLVAWLVSLPLVAVHFSQLNTWAVLGSLLMAPLLVLVLVCGWIKILGTAMVPAAGPWLADLSAGASALMRWGVDQLARLPWADVPLPAPPIWIVVIYFVLLPMAIYRWPRPSLRIGARSSLAGCLLLMFILPFSLGAAPAPRLDPVMRITLLAVGAGQCAIVQPPGGRVFVIDAGSNTLSDPLRRAIAPALRELRITSVDTLLITHANYDHFSAAGELAEAYGVREVLVAPRFREQAGTTTPGALLVSALDAADRPPREVQAGQVIPIARDARIEVLHPSSDDRLEPNDSSLVIRLTFGQASVLMTGDIQERGIAALLAREGATLSADVLVAPHHGSIENNTADLLARVRPRLILSSNDRRLTLRQRDFAVLAGTTPLLRTHTSGAITLELRADGQIHAIEHLRPSEPLVLPSRN